MGTKKTLIIREDSTGTTWYIFRTLYKGQKQLNFYFGKVKERETVSMEEVPKFVVPEPVKSPQPLKGETLKEIPKKPASFKNFELCADGTYRSTQVTGRKS